MEEIRRVQDLPKTLRGYIVLVAGIGAVLLAFLLIRVEWELSTLGELGLFTLLIAIAGCFPVRIAPRVTGDVSTAVLFGAALIMEPGMAALAAVAGMLAYNGLMRFRRDGPRLPWYKYPFNAGETALSTGLASLIFHALSTDDSVFTPAVLAAGVCMQMVDTSVVTVAASLQLKANPLRFWWVGTVQTGSAALSLFAIGFLGAMAYQQNPWATVAVGIPVVLIYFTLSRMARTNEQLTQEISDRKLAEEALRQAEERLHAVVDNSPIIIFALDRDGVFTLSEGKGLEALGRAPGQVVGQSIFELYRDMPAISDNIRLALGGESRYLVVGIGGITFEAHYRPLWEAGQVTGVVGVVHDITALKEAEETVLQRNDELEALQGRIVGTSKLASIGAISLDLAHQIKNPLAILMGRLENVEEGLRGGSQTRRNLDIAVKAGRRIEELTRTFGTIGKQEWVPLDILELLEEAHGMASLRNRKRITTTRDFRGDSSKVKGNPVLIREAFSNLFSNSMEALDEGGLITIDASQENGEVVVHISDTGQGIPPERMDRLFEPFNSTKPNGYGVGLFATKHIIEMHNGSVVIESVEGVGTRVTVSLPALPVTDGAPVENTGNQLVER